MTGLRGAVNVSWTTAADMRPPKALKALCASDKLEEANSDTEESLSVIENTCIVELPEPSVRISEKDAPLRLMLLGAL